METIAKLEMDRKTFHVYRRVPGGPLTLSVQAPYESAFMSIDISPTLMMMLGRTLIEASSK